MPYFGYSRYPFFLAALHGLLAEDDREQLVVRLRIAADRAYDQLASGLGEYGRRA